MSKSTRFDTGSATNPGPSIPFTRSHQTIQKVADNCASKFQNNSRSSNFNKCRPERKSYNMTEFQIQFKVKKINILSHRKSHCLRICFDKIEFAHPVQDKSQRKNPFYERTFFKTTSNERLTIVSGTFSWEIQSLFEQHFVADLHVIAFRAQRYCRFWNCQFLKRALSRARIKFETS